MGRALFPPAPDMRAARTQRLSDGELFYVIEHGIPFTGMPAWSTGTGGGERASWELVRFIRLLPELADQDIAEMEKMNPKSQMDMDMQHRIDDFLKGKGGQQP